MNPEFAVRDTRARTPYPVSPAPLAVSRTPWPVSRAPSRASPSPKWQYLIPKGLFARRNNTLVPQPAAVALSRMACATVTHAGIPYARSLATAAGMTLDRKAICCGLKCGELPGSELKLQLLFTSGSGSVCTRRRPHPR